MNTVTRPDQSPLAALSDLVSAVFPGDANVQTSTTGFRLAVGGTTVDLAEADALDLVAGRTDPALLYLADRLRIQGDPAALVALTDPAALDPEAVSAAIAGVPTTHLDAVMAGPFRDVVLGEVFRRLPEFLKKDKAERVTLVVGFEVGGRSDGRADRYVVRIADAACTATPDPTGEQGVDVTLVLTGAQFLRLVLGHLNPVRAVLNREVTIRGELFKALAFNSVMRIPGI